MVWHETYCMDGGNSFEFVKPPNTRCSGTWLYPINWIKSGNQKIPETCVVLWHYKTVLHLQQVLCVANSEMETCWESCY